MLSRPSRRELEHRDLAIVLCFRSYFGADTTFNSVTGVVIGG
jgi:hypothetical protein